MIQTAYLTSSIEVANTHIQESVLHKALLVDLQIK
jgi:hypothetical protein